MTKSYPHEFRQLGVVVLTASRETAYAAAAPIARARGRLREPYAPAYASARVLTRAYAHAPL